MLKQIIFGIFLSCTSVACYQVIPVSSSPLVGATASTFWDCRTRNVYYGNYFGSGSAPVIFRYDYVTTRTHSASIEGYSGGVSNLIPMSCAPNQFVAILGTCVVAIYWDGFSSTAIHLREIFCVDEDFPNHTITYAKADLKRRLYVGTAQTTYCDVAKAAESSLYHYSRLRGVDKNFNSLRASAGMDWNIFTRKFYHKDVCQNSLMEYEWSPLSGELSRGHSVFTFTDTNSVVNAMTIDNFGMLYVTLYNASSVLKINPRTSTIVATYDLPGRFPTSLTFCGRLLDTLCVNTGDVPVDTSTGSIANTAITASDGKLYLIKNINTWGHCDRKVCI